MTISVVQTSIDGTGFVSPVTAHNSIILAHTSYSSTSGATLGSSNPLYNGSTPADSVLLTDRNSPDTPDVVYTALWLLPDVAGGGKSFGITDTGTNVQDLNLSGIEVAGLGPAPRLDTAGGTSAGSGTGTTGSSGSIPALANAPAILIGQGVWYGQDPTGPGAPWTELNPALQAALGYQIVTTAGAAYSFAPATSTSANWATVIAAVIAAPAASGSGLLLAMFP